MSDFKTADVILAEHIAAELTSLENAVARLRELLNIGSSPQHRSTPQPIRWNTETGPKGSYEWIHPRQNRELAGRLRDGRVLEDGYTYWLAEDVGVIMRRKL
jgi:hypothetical protein